MHYKRIIFIFSIIIIFSIITIICLQSNDKVIFKSGNISDNRVINSNSLAMMYETDYNSGEYQVSSDTTWPQDGYTFNETLSKCENGSRIYWDDSTNRVIVETNTIDNCYVYFDKEPILLTNYITNYIYTGTDGENSLYYHDGNGTYTNADQEAEDNSYRFSGANPNNYVCFGSTTTPCPAENLYRIIGVFEGQVKLIKYDYTSVDMTGSNGEYAGSYSSSTAFYLGNMLKNNISVYYYRNSSNTIWGESELNLINLNNIFLNYIGEQFANKIAIHPWVVRGNDYLINSIAKNIVQLEVINPGLNTIFEGKIGLMYVSDYAYAADSNYWNLTVSRYTDITGDNWMYMGLFEWTITDYYSSSSIYCLSDQGRVSSGSSSAYAVRPVFYLNSDVIYVSGTGTQTDPYQIQ